MQRFSTSHPRSQCSLSVIAIFFVCLSATGQTTLPYENDFESPDFTPGILQSDPDWAFDPLTLSVEITDAEAASASQSLALQGSAPFVLDFNDPNTQPIRWIDFYLKPVFSSADSLPETIAELRSAVAAFVAEGGSGQVYVIHGDGFGSGTWVSAQRPIELSDGRAQDWLRLSYRLDYAQQRWDLFLNDQLALFNLGFLDNSFQQLQQFQLQTSADRPTGLDFFYAGLNNPIAEDADNDGIPDSLDPDPYANDRDLDADNDGLINIHELQLGTALNLRDSDGDGLADSLEGIWELDPLALDTHLAQLSNIGNSSMAKWKTGFETAEGYVSGPLNTQQDWHASDTVQVEQQQARMTFTDGQQHYFERYFGIDETSEIWFSFRAVLLPGSLPNPSELTEPAVALWGSDHPASISIWQPETQLWQSFPTTANTTDWNEYLIQLDYQSQEWMLLQNEKVIAHSIPFKDTNLVAFSRFKALQAGMIAQEDPADRVAYFDDFQLSNTEPAGLDFDQDGLLNSLERSLQSDLFAVDTDADGLPDAWEYQFGLDLVKNDAEQDADADLISNYAEFVRGQNPNIADENLDGFLDGQSIPGSVLMQQWDIEKRPKRHEINYIDRTDVVNQYRLDRLEWNRGPITLESPFGYRARGYLTAPQSGLYQFWVYGDDYVEFWLSDNQSTSGAKRIAFNLRPNFVGQFLQYSGQSSKWIYLQAGERHYFDIFHYGDTISDYFAIAWKYGSLAQPSIIGGEHISSFVWDAEDLDDDGLSDAQERLYGLDPLSNTGRHGRLGDYDKDGWSNFWELQRGSDPSIHNPFPKRSRSELFPQVEHVDTHALDNWSLTDIGRPNQHDAFEQENGTVHIACSGKNYHNFAYAYQRLSAPFKITTQVQYTYFEDTNADAGIKIRDSLANRSAYYDLSFAPDGRISARMRPERVKHNVNLHNIYHGEHSEVWLRVEYDGTTLTSAYSYDQVQWFELDSQILNWSGDLYVGLAASSLDSLEVIGAQFDAITIDQDSDGDGLWDSEEASLGTDPLLADTDGDGYSDFDELNNIGSDPLVFDGMTIGEIVAHNSGSEAAVRAGSWKQNGTALHAMDYRGELEYLLDVPVDGYYRLDLTIREASRYRGASEFKLDAQLGALPLGLEVARASYNEPATIRYWLPWIQAGTKALTLDWINHDLGAALQVDSVQLRPLNFESDQARILWQARHQADEFTVPTITQSITSPYNLVGTASDWKLVSATADSSEKALAVTQALSGKFQTDVPLKASATPTHLQLLYADEHVTAEAFIQWTLTDLNSSNVDNPLIIRQGDSLLLGRPDPTGDTALASSYLEIFSVPTLAATLPSSTELSSYAQLASTPDSTSLADFLQSGQSNPVEGIEASTHQYASGTTRAFSNAAQRETTPLASSSQITRMDHFGLLTGEAATLQFTQPGYYLVRTAWLTDEGELQQATLAIDVPEIELGPAVSSTVDYTRWWIPEQLAEDTTLIADTSLYLAEAGSSQPRTFRLFSNSEQAARIIARTHPDGPIADTVDFLPVINYSTQFNNHLKVLDTFTDGAQLVEFDIALGGELADDFEILIQPFKAGVTFDDGTLSRTITAADLDELGRYQYRLIIPADVPGSACHFYQIRQDNNPINRKI